MPRDRRRSASLRRPTGTKQPRKRVVVVCEGKRTEPDYLQLIHRRSVSALVELDVVDESSTDPTSLVDRAVALLQSARRTARKNKDPNSLIDEIWCIFDVDEHPHIAAACQRASDNGVQLAVSNPSFELWLALHFRDQSAWIHRRDAFRLIREEIKDYDKRISDLAALEGRFEMAKSRAMALSAKHVGDGTSFPDDNPSSDVWLLVDSLDASY